MRAVVLAAVLALVSSLAAAPARALESGGDRSCVVRADLTGLITADDARYIQRAVRISESAGCEAALLVVDSPGGELDATRRVIEAILRARVPVVGYVPPGGHAGAASALVMLASHVAAVAPDATLGFGSIGPTPPRAAGTLSENAALARFLAAHRQRNASWAESAVYEQRSVGGDEAALVGAADLVAADVASLLQELDGERLKVLGTPVRLSLRDARVHEAPVTWRHLAARAVSQPNLLYALLMLGVLGVLLELYRPGMLLPGLVGTGALLASAFGLHLLPVDMVALALLAIAVVLFGAELRFKGYGALTAGGIVALLLGSLRLLDAHHPGFFLDVNPHISWGAVLPVAAALGGITAVLSHASAQRRKAEQQSAAAGA